MAAEAIGQRRRPTGWPEDWAIVRLGVGAGVLLLLVLTWMLPPLYVAAAVVLVSVVALTLRFPVVALGLLAFSVPWGGGFPLAVGSFPITSTEVLVGGLGTTWLCSAVYSRRNPIATRVWVSYLVIFIGVMALSVTQATDVRASEREIFKWIELVVVYLSAVWFIRGKAELNLVLVAIVAAGVSQAFLGFVQVLFHLGPQAFASQRLVLRAYGTFDQPNPYAGYLNMVLPLSLALALCLRQRGQQILYGFSFVLIAGGVLASGSRGALLGTMAAVVIVVAIRFRGIRNFVWLGIVAGLATAWTASFGLLPSGPIERVMTAVGVGGVSFGHVTDANFSAVERAAHWLAGVRMFAAHPILGVGIGNYAAAYPAYHPRGWYASLEHAHNYYINISAEAGIFGLSSYLLVAGSALWYSYASIRLALDRVHYAVGLGVLGALVATNVHNLFDVLYVHGLAALLGLLVALVAVSLRDGAGESFRRGTS